MFNTNDKYYHAHIKRYIATLGTLLNQIVIDRTDDKGKIEKEFAVPVAYGPAAKWITRLNQDSDSLQQTPAITMPRISFEMISLSYDGSRKLTMADAYRQNKDVYNFLSNNTPAPYNLNFNCTIIVKYSEDGAKIVEQILPFFKPEWTSHVRLIDDLDLVMDIPVILNSVDVEDIYEGDFEQRRVITWNLTFTMKAYFFGPNHTRKVIKFVDVNFHSDTNAAAPVHEELHITPGMTKFREPTRDPKQSIDYKKIEYSDPWDWAEEILSIEDYHAGRVS